MAPEHPGESGLAAEGAVEQAAHLALLARMRAGDEEALGALYDATVSRLYSLALRLTRAAQTAEEVVEEAYFQAWRQAERYDPARGPVIAWLLTICRSRALDTLRRADPAEVFADPDALRTGEAQTGADPCDLLAATRRDSAVHAALVQLTPQARQLVALAFFRGLTHGEIATHSGLPLGTVKTTLHRACRKLQALLANEKEDGDEQ